MKTPSCGSEADENQLLLSKLQLISQQIWPYVKFHVNSIT